MTATRPTPEHDRGGARAAIGVRPPILLQAGYYLLTGLWPLVHLPSFEAVTGPKTDDWLVRVVGVLVLVIGGTLGLGAVRLRRALPSPELLLTLALATAAAFILIDVGFVLAGTIGTIYLADAAVEAGLVVWIVGTSVGRET